MGWVTQLSRARRPASLSDSARIKSFAIVLAGCYHVRSVTGMNTH